MFFQYTVLTFIVSYIAFLMFEIPFANIERLFWRKPMSPPKQHTIEDINHNTNNGNHSDHELGVDNTKCYTNYAANLSNE